jgi:hypothetical protein
MESENEIGTTGSRPLDHLVRHPLPWTVKCDQNQLDILDANGARLIWGNVNREIEYDDPIVPEILAKALKLFAGPSGV